MRAPAWLIIACALAGPACAQSQGAQSQGAAPPSRVVDLGPERPDAAEVPAPNVAPATRYAQQGPPIYSMSHAQEAARETGGAEGQAPSLADIDRQWGTHYAADAAKAAQQAAAANMLVGYVSNIYIFGGAAYAFLVFLVSFLLIWRALARWIGRNGLVVGFIPAAVAAFVLAAGTALAWPLLIMAPLLFIGAGNTVLADQIKAVIDAAKPAGAESGGKA